MTQSAADKPATTGSAPPPAAPAAPQIAVVPPVHPAPPRPPAPGAAGAVVAPIPLAPGPRPVAPPAPGTAPPAAPPLRAAPLVADARPPVGSARMRTRHRAALVSFLLCVIVPPIIAAAYLWTLAADQYASRVGFSVRSEETSTALEILGGLTNLSGSSSSDTDILYEFIQSQRLVEELDAELDLRAMWSRPADDIVFRLEPDASIEDLVDYWNGMVRLSRGKGAGLLEVEVRAFSPDDATRIATALLSKSAEMINNLSAIAREDAIRFARADLDDAVERLKKAREAVTRFRNVNQIVNPELDIQSQAGLLATLQGQQAAILIEIDLLRDSARPDDPRLVQFERRLQVIEQRIAAERRKLGLGGEGSTHAAFADLVGEYERLAVDREFAERAYVTALATYDAAVAEARRLSRYLAPYMEPTRAETAQYPKRGTLLAMLTLFLFLIWSIAVLIYYSVRDRR